MGYVVRSSNTWSDVTMGYGDEIAVDSYIDAVNAARRSPAPIIDLIARDGRGVLMVRRTLQHPATAGEPFAPQDDFADSELARFGLSTDGGYLHRVF